MNQGNLWKAGKVKSSLAKDFGIRQDIFYADLDTNLLFQSANPKFEVTKIVRH
jgi:phenylalanyl-tRNA synthetase beta chain